MKIIWLRAMKGAEGNLQQDRCAEGDKRATNPYDVSTSLFTIMIDMLDEP